MALYLNIISRHCGKLRGIQKIGTTQMSTLSTIRNTDKCILGVPTTFLRNEKELTRSFSTTTPKLSAGGGHHTLLWSVERALSLGLLGIVPAAIAFPSQGLDALLAISIVMHQHWGLEAVVTDYVRPILLGNVIPQVAHVALLLVSIATLGGLFYFIYNDIGIAKAIRKLWAVKGQ